MNHYAPYGEVWGEQGVAQTPFGFTGEPTDDNGLVYLRARYYNPALGVFPSLDPLEGSLMQPQSLNRYPYVQDNPTNLTDPSGLIFENPADFSSCQQSAGNDICIQDPRVISKNICLKPCENVSNTDKKTIQQMLVGLTNFGVYLTSYSPISPCQDKTSSSGECLPGCWDVQKVQTVLQSVVTQALRIAMVGGNFKDFLPASGIHIVMSAFADTTPPDAAAITLVKQGQDPYTANSPRIVIWDNGNASFPTNPQSIIYSPELITHEFGHVINYTCQNKTQGRYRLHNEFITSAKPNVVLVNLDAGLPVWLPFIQASRSQYLDEYGRFYGNRVTLDPSVGPDEKTAEGYAIWIHRRYNVTGEAYASNTDENNLRPFRPNPNFQVTEPDLWEQLQESIRNQRGFWENFFSTTDTGCAS